MEGQINFNIKNPQWSRFLSNLKKRYIARGVILILMYSSLGINCRQSTQILDSDFKYHKPQYGLVQLQVNSDTIKFPLTENTYNTIKSFNLFTESGKEYISFFDDRSSFISIYDFQTQTLTKQIQLKDWFSNKKLYKTTVFVKSLDSIYVTNKNAVYLIDKSGKIKKSIDFLKDPQFAWATFDNTNPPVFNTNYFYAGVRPYVKANSLDALNEWRLLYRFDLQNSKAELIYHLPKLYRQNLFGNYFLDYNYCYNSKGNFVFSFPADTNIYETNLTDYHVSYLGKSQYQVNPIKPLTKKIIDNNEENYKNYITQDSYGPIYYDPQNKRYLRIAKSGIPGKNYSGKNWKRDSRIIIFNEQLQIIGESRITDGISYNSIFFSRDGGIYARTKASDEYAIHFVRLYYNNQFEEQIPLSKK